VFGNYPLRGFNLRLIEGWQSERAKRNSPATVNRLLATLKHMFTKALEWEMVGEEALKGVRKVKLLKEPPGRLRFLSKEECRALVEACSPHLKPIVTTALNTGMRRGEILGLKWERVDLKHGFILLDVTKNGERREIPINFTLREVFESIPHGPESEFVFVDRYGRPYKSVNNSFPTACRRAGISDFRFHDLRHTAASHLIMAGVDLATVKELLGHKTLTMTLRYAHLAPGHKVKAMDVLAKELRGAEGSSEDLLYNHYIVKQGVSCRR
ncbi:MAG: tyrosine-type recombinase/integrase, partial [Planctomycetota bacterium]